MTKPRYSVIYSPEAQDDLLNIAFYIICDLKNPQSGKRIYDLVSKSIRQLDIMPLRHPVVDWEPWKSKCVRKMPVARFSVFYRVDEESRSIQIVRIIYGGMDAVKIAQENE